MANSGKLYDLFVPGLDDLKSSIKTDLSDAFQNVSCEIVDCPDLTQEPFNLAAKGICGNPIIADIGGFANLLPLPNLNARFDFAEVMTNGNLADGFICGAGGGPFYELDINSEIVVNAKFEKFKILDNKTLLAKMENNNNATFPAKSTNFGLLGQFLCCQGKPGKVLKVTAEIRKLDGSILSFIQKSLAKHYGSGESAVGLGGVVLVHTGNVKIHVMPEFSQEPLDSPTKVNEWLKFFHVPAPFVAVGEMVSHDPWNLDLRMEHFHGFTSDRTQAGHFHYDVTPDTVKYSVYLVPGKQLLRMNQPKHK